MNTAPEINFHNFNPDIIATTIAQKNWSGCWSYLQKLIESFSYKTNPQFNMKLQSGMGNDAVQDYLSQFGQLMGELLYSLLADPSIKMPDDSYFELMPYHENIHSFFQISGHSHTDPLIDQIFSGKNKPSPSQQKKALLLLSMRSKRDLPWIIRKVDNEYRAIAICSFLCYLRIYDQNIYQNKIDLLSVTPEIRKARLNLKNPAVKQRVLNSLIELNFACSYIDHEDKHQIKNYVNEIIRLVIQKSGPAQEITKQEGLEKYITSEKPKALISLEQYAPGHPMWRSWAKWIASIEDHFTTILTIPRLTYNGSFDEQDNVFIHENWSDYLNIVEQFKPDIIINPSIGLSMHGVMSANARLAPLQIMALGHPATSMSDHIDFVYGQSVLYTEKAFPKDRFIADDTPYTFAPILSKEELRQIPVSSYDPRDKRPLRVSITGAEVKMSYPFICLLQRLEQNCPHEIEFHFHLSSAGIDSLIVENDLKGKFKNFHFNGFQRYDKFLAAIGQSDIVLNPFPFGHTNTIIDTLILGKPCISMDGYEPASLTEKYVLELTDVADQFMVNSTTAYAEKFYALVNRITTGDTHFYDRDSMYNKIYGISENPMHNYGKNLQWLFDNYQNLMALGDKSFTIPAII